MPTKNLFLNTSPTLSRATSGNISDDKKSIIQSIYSDINKYGLPNTTKNVGEHRNNPAVISKPKPKGYVNVKKLSLAERKKAIDKAVKEYGRLTVIRKLNILRTLHKNKNPMLSKKHGVDMKYVQTKYKK